MMSLSGVILAYMQVADHTGAQWCNAFGDKALPIFNGLSANDLKKMERQTQQSSGTRLSARYSSK